MYKLVATLTTLFLLGGCIVPATSAPAAIISTTIESVVTACTTCDTPAVDINTTINETPVKRPPNHGLGNGKNVKRWIFW